MTGDRGFGRGQHPEELLSASLTGDLAPAERAQLDAHLAGCAQCRDTLEAFAEERRLIAGLREVTPPRDLGARVRAGIERSGPGSIAWWRRPATLVGAFASVATVAAATLAVIVFSNALPGPIGSTDQPSPSSSVSASATPVASMTAAPSVEPTPAPTAAPPVALEPGQIGYLQLDGEPQTPLDLGFVNDATAEVTDIGTASGAPRTAAISPTNEFVAYTVELGLSGANQLRLTRLSDGMTEVLGCTVSSAFTDRLAWSDDGHYLAYTLRPVDLGESVDCGGVTGDGTQTDAWVYDAVGSGEATKLTDAGNAFVGDFGTSTDEVQYPLLVSYAAPQPYTEVIGLGSVGDPSRIDGVFLPLLSPDASRALFWRGEMEQVTDGGWHFLRGGMPYVSGEPVNGQPSWSGEPLFADLEPVGGAAFESGQFAWSPDGTLVGFWLGEWTGPPQSDDGSYPSSRDVYVGPVAGLLSQDSRIEIELQELQGVVDLAIDDGTGMALLTVVQPSAGDLAVPASTLYAVPLNGGEPTILGTGASWTGPAVIGLEAVELPR
ncbi:MAG TPA: zf-HC2 domain-containing protein [Candidatus Limnocylindria bacterium]